MIKKRRLPHIVTQCNPLNRREKREHPAANVEQLLAALRVVLQVRDEARVGEEEHDRGAEVAHVAKGEER